MTVTDNGDGTFTVATTAEELAAFTQAVEAGLIDGKTPAAALHGFLGQAFNTMVGTARRQMIEEIQKQLPSVSTENLKSLLTSVKH
jgi:hypothetical protein